MSLPVSTNRTAVLDADISELDLSVGTWKSLKKLRIGTIRELVAYTAQNNWATCGLPLGIRRSKEIAEVLGIRRLADTDILLLHSGYPLSRYKKGAVFLSRMILSMPGGGSSCTDAV